jgi:hypothetical protein
MARQIHIDMGDTSWDIYHVGNYGYCMVYGMVYGM